MTVQDHARTALAAIMEQHSTGVVTVTSGSTTVNGFRGTRTTDSELSGYGLQEGQTDNVVRVDASAFSEPARGATITVDGSAVFVTTTRLDPIGATLLIEYSRQRPVE